MLNLSTAFALLVLFACAFLTWRAHQAAEDAKDAERSLSRTQGKLASHDLLLSALHTSVKRIDGKVGALQARLRAPVSSAAEGGDLPALADDGMDPELAAELALQRAPAASPGKSQ